MPTDTAAAESRECSFCKARARYEAGTENLFVLACGRHLARAVDVLADDSPDDLWFKVAIAR